VSRVRVFGTRTGIFIAVSVSDRRRLEALVRERNAAQKHAWRAQIVLLSADCVGTNEIMRRTGRSKTCVWRWQERFMQESFDGLLRDKTRPSRLKPLGAEVAERIVALTLKDAPTEATHWTGAMMAKAAGVSVSSVRRIWCAHRLQLHRVRQFVALNILNGRVIGRNMQRHRHQDFIHFLNAIEAEIPAGKVVHVILDNYAAHKHPKVRHWLDGHERFTFHFTPTSCSWLNAVEGFFAKLTKRRLKRGVFRSIVDLRATINRFLSQHNEEPKPFTSTADPDKIIAAVTRWHQALDSIH
jgi:transposase